jgi:hypothetical protein
VSSAGKKNVDGQLDLFGNGGGLEEDKGGSLECPTSRSFPEAS